HYARIDAELLERILHGKSVHDSCKHAHVIGGSSVEALGRRRHAPKNVAATDDEAELMALSLGCRDLTGETVDRPRIDPELALTHQRLARELQEDAVETWSGHSAAMSSTCNKGRLRLYGRAAPLPTALKQPELLSDGLGLGAGGGRDFGGEVFLLLLDAFTE